MILILAFMLAAAATAPTAKLRAAAAIGSALLSAFAVYMLAVGKGALLLFPAS